MINKLEKTAEEIRNEENLLAVKGYFQHKDDLRAEELERQSRARERVKNEEAEQKIAYIYTFKYLGKREYRIKDTRDGSGGDATFEHKKLKDFCKTLLDYAERGYTIKNNIPPHFVMGSYTCGSDDPMILAYRPRISPFSKKALNRLNKIFGKRLPI